MKKPVRSKHNCVYLYPKIRHWHYQTCGGTAIIKKKQPSKRIRTNARSLCGKNLKTSSFKSDVSSFSETSVESYFGIMREKATNVSGKLIPSPQNKKGKDFLLFILRSSVMLFFLLPSFKVFIRHVFLYPFFIFVNSPLFF